MKKRYFFVSTVGKLPNGNLSFNNFDILKTGSSYPTMKKILEISKEKFPEQSNLILLSISELSQEDFEQFASEQ